MAQTYAQIERELINGLDFIAKNSPEVLIKQSGPLFGADAMIYKDPIDPRYPDNPNRRLGEHLMTSGRSDGDNPIILEELQHRSNVTRMNTPRRMFLEQRHGGYDREYPLDSSIALNNYIYAFIGSIFDHLPRAEKEAKIRAIARQKLSDRTNGRFASDYRAEINQLTEGALQEIGSDVAEIDNPYLYMDINREIYDGVGKIFDDASEATKSKLRGERGVVLPQQSTLNAQFMVDNGTNSIVKQINAKRPQNNQLPDAKEQELRNLINDYAKASVSTMISKCLKTPESTPDGKGMIIDGKVVKDENTPYNVSEMQFAVLMRNSVNDKRDSAWRALQDFMKANGIETAGIKVKSGGKDMDFEGMVNNVTTGYFTGYINTNHGLAHYLDAGKIENMVPTRVHSTDPSIWQKWQERWDNGSAYENKEDEHSRRLRDTKKLQKQKEKTSAGKTNAKTPYRALFKLYQRALRIVQNMMSSFQNVGYLLRYMDAVEGVKPEPNPVVIEKKMREKFRKELHIDVFHFDLMEDSLKKNRSAEAEQVNTLKMQFAKMYTKIDDPAEDIKDLMAKKAELLGQDETKPQNLSPEVLAKVNARTSEKMADITHVVYQHQRAGTWNKASFDSVLTPEAAKEFDITDSTSAISSYPQRKTPIERHALYQDLSPHLDKYGEHMVKGLVQHQQQMTKNNLLRSIQFYDNDQPEQAAKILFGDANINLQALSQTQFPRLIEWAKRNQSAPDFDARFKKSLAGVKESYTKVQGVLENEP